MGPTWGYLDGWNPRKVVLTYAVMGGNEFFLKSTTQLFDQGCMI